MIGAGIGITQVACRGQGGAAAFSPLSLFSSGEEGAWYDPSDLSTLFQDAAGTVPVTADSQPVRLMLDKSGNDNHATAPSDAARPLYKTAGGLHWLEFDGVDDSMSTAAINFAVTDAMSLFVGAEKSALTLAEIIDTAYPSGSGKFFIRAGNATTSSAQWSSASRGSSAPAVDIVAVSLNVFFNAGVKSAITAQFDISSDQNILRVNGALERSAVGDQGAGNFASTPIYLGARSGTSLFFPGLLYQAVIRGAASSAQELADAEAHIAAKSGVTLP